MRSCQLDARVSRSADAEGVVSNPSLWYFSSQLKSGAKVLALTYSTTAVPLNSWTGMCLLICYFF